MRTLIKLIFIFVLFSLGAEAQNTPKPNVPAPQGLSVNSFTGNLFYQRNEQSLRGTGFRIYQTFYYNAAQDTINYGYGHGWSFYYNSFYKESKDTVIIQHADARKDIFLLKNGTYIAPIGVFDVLTKNGNTFSLRAKDGQVRTFGDASHKKLTRIEDANGNFIAIDYTGGYPSNIKNSAGKSLSLIWEKNLLKEAQDSSNPEKKYSYAYNKDADLISVTDPMNGKKTYSYKKHFLISVSDENGNPVGIDYVGGTGRVKQIVSCSTDQRFTFLDSLRKTFVTQKGANGDITNGYFFDEKGRLIGLSDPDNNKMEFVYDERNNLLEAKDFAGKSTHYTYDEKGNLLSETDPLNNVEVYVYDGTFNRPISIKDKKAHITVFDYDGKGNLKTLRNSNGKTESYIYDQSGRRISATNANNNTTSFQYDNEGNLIKIAYPLGFIEYQYNNSCCDVSNIKDANGNTLEMGYDLMGRKKTSKDGLGNINTYNYDAVGNLIKETDPNGNIKTYTYDGSSRLISATTSAGTWKYSYDKQGNMITLTNAKSGNTIYSYNNKNQLIKEIDPMGNNTSYSYDLIGNLIQKIDPSGNIVNYKYDDLNRLTERNYQGNIDKYVYDEVDNIIGAYNNNIEYTFEYDEQNQLLRKNINNWNKSISYTYDAVGNRKTMVNHDGGTSTYEYDQNNRLIGLKNADELLTQFEYDKGGRITKQINANGTYTTYKYDQGGRVNELINWGSNGKKISFFIYTFDNYGNRKTMTDKHGLSTYVYDASNCLTEVVYADGKTENLVIDQAGNRTQRIKNGITTNYTYNSADQIQSAGSNDFIFDANGNTIKETGIVKRTFKYDGENRLLEGQSGSNEVQYKYDPFGDKIEIKDASSLIRHLIYDGENLLGELNSNNKTLNTYTTGLTVDSWIAMKTVDNIFFYQKDGSNSVMELTGPNGDLLNQYQYDVFGEILNKQEVVENSILYTGRFFDRTLGLYDNRSRLYNPSIGRFTTRDNYENDNYDVQQWNKYNYVNSNPVNYIDFDGKNPVLVAMGFGALVGGGIEVAKQLYDNHKSGKSGICYKDVLVQAAIGGALGGAASKFLKTPIDLGLQKVGMIGRGSTIGSLQRKVISSTKNEVYRSIRRFGRNRVFLLKETKDAVLKFAAPFMVGKLATAGATAPFKYGANKLFDYLNDASENVKDFLNKSCDDPEEPEGPDDPIPVPPNDNQPIKFPIVVPKDPNEIIGTAGIDTTKKWVSVKQTLTYKVLFENDPEFATAAARKVTVYVPITANVNPSSLRLSDFGFGSFNFTVPPNTSFYTNRLDLRDSLGMYVDITAGLDVTNRRAFWIFDSIDPETGLAGTLPAEKGFLPVNDKNIHNGEGYVNFTMIPTTDAKTLDTLIANASILFDDEGSINTNTWKNTIDAFAPVSKINTSDLKGNQVTLNWSGTDDTGGTGIKDYTLYVAENGQPYQLHKSGIKETSYVFEGTTGSRYDFFIIATDLVGNIEPLKKNADIHVAVGGPKRSQTISFTKPASPTYGDADFTLKATASSGLPVTFTIDNTTAATVSGDKLHILKAGTIKISAKQNGNDIYEAATAEEILTIAKKELIVSAGDKIKFQGDPLPAFTLTYKGFVGDENPSKLTDLPLATTTATIDSAPGTYPITVSGGTSENYTFKYTGATLTVNKQLDPLVFTNLPAKTYGDPDFNLNATSGRSIQYSLSNTGTITILPSGKVHIVAAGTVEITASDGRTSIKQMLIVNKAPLTIGVKNLVRKYNEENPAFTITYTGFLNSDGESTISVKPTASTTATKLSVPGVYPITLSAGISANYSLNAINGTLSIEPALRTFTMNDLVKTYGDPDFKITVGINTAEAITYTSSNTVVATVNNDKVHINAAGATIITAAVAPNNNYSGIDRVTANLTVNKATQTIVFETIPLLQRRGNAYALQVSASSGLPIELVISDRLVASLNGISLQPLSLGNGKVTAKQSGNTNYMAASEVIRDFRVTDASNSSVQVRQAISVDGDGINDFLVIEGITDYPENRLVIVNRNGSKIFEATNYDNHQNVFVGKNSNGENLPAGTYYYVLTYKTDGKQERQTGYFILKY